MQALIRHACNQAELSGREIGLRVGSDGYSFSMLGFEGWMDGDQKDALRPRVWVPGLQVELFRDGSATRVPDSDAEQPQIVCFSSGELSPFLRSDHMLSQRAFVESVFGGEHYAAWGEIEESLRTGRTAFDSHYGMPVFDWYSQNPDDAQMFSRAMASTTMIIEAGLLAAWTPPPFELAIDVGGSRGTLVSSLLRNAPSARGIQR
jgi:hypothetical protein